MLSNHLIQYVPHFRTFFFDQAFGALNGSCRASLLQQVWSGDTYVTERTVDTVISRLRRKIERDPQDPEMLLTAWGVGYKFSDLAG